MIGILQFFLAVLDAAILSRFFFFFFSRGGRVSWVCWCELVIDETMFWEYYFIMFVGSRHDGCMNGFLV